MAFKVSQTLRVVWLLPTPVRTAQTATTGLVDLIMVWEAPSRLKVAPQAMTSEALFMT